MTTESTIVIDAPRSDADRASILAAVRKRRLRPSATTSEDRERLIWRDVVATQRLAGIDASALLPEPEVTT